MHEAQEFTAKLPSLQVEPTAFISFHPSRNMKPRNTITITKKTEPDPAHYSHATTHSWRRLPSATPFLLLLLPLSPPYSSSPSLPYSL